jgi:putative nucleotidyltransferase with HDIG domain
MPLRTKVYVSITLLLAAMAGVWSLRYPMSSWPLFSFLLVLVLVSSTLKIALPRGDSGMSLNFPFIFLAILLLSPGQALLLGAISMAVQCRIRTKKSLSGIQVAFNVASTVLATGAASGLFVGLKAAGLHSALSLSLASVAYFLVSTSSVALVVSSASKERPFTLWKNEFPYYLPFYLVGAALALTTEIVSRRLGWETSLLLIPMVYTVYRAYNAQMIRLREREQHLGETEALQLRTIEGLSMAIEAKDRNTHDHLFRVRDYVQEMGQTLNLGRLEMQALHTASFLHDIGKLAVPEQIINKPGKLTPEEFEKMKIHPVVGADILERVRFPYPVVPIVRSHHEWWDGSGYPDGLKGEEIPLGARILSAADCFDALVSDRPYRKALPVPEALALIQRMSGKQFDPKIVELLTKLHERRVEQENAKAGSTFTALKTDIEVVRGEAPAAGFEGDTAHRAGQKKQPAAAVAAADEATAASIGWACEEIHALYERSLSMEPKQNLRDALCLWAAVMREVVCFDTCAFFARNGDSLCLRHVEGYDAKSFSRQSFAPGDGISGWVAQSGKPLLNGNVDLEVGYHSKLDAAGRLKSAVAIPVTNLEGGQVGVLTLYSMRTDAFEKNHLRILTAVSTKTAMLMARVLENSAAKQSETLEAEWASFYTQMAMEVARAEGSGERLAIAVWSLNRDARSLRERRGDDCGALDRLTEMFSHLRQSGGSVGRLGGNQFVLLRRVSTATSGEELEAMQQSLRSLSRRASVSGSIGTATFPEDANTAEELLAIAEVRMYRSRRTAEERDGRVAEIAAPATAYETSAVA